MKQISTYVMVVTVLLVTCLVVEATALAQQPGGTDIEPAYASGEVLVKFKPQLDVADNRKTLQKEGLQISRMSNRRGVIRLQVPAGQEAATVERLRGRDDVAYALPNYLVEAFEEPDDIYYELGYQWSLEKISAPAAWDMFTGSNNITIAVIDTGMDLDHADLAPKRWTNPGEIPNNNIDDDNNGFKDDIYGYDFINNDGHPDDDHGHGSHVSGIAAAATNNGLGIAGVNWNASIMSLKILNGAGNGSIDDIAEAVYYAVDNGAKVINLSLGINFSKWPCGWTNVAEAFNYALSNNVLIVVASGNNSQSNVSCPGAYDQVMAVGSTTSDDSRSSFSNYGPRLDIVAPGSSIFSANNEQGYMHLSGTSMATPHVAGLAALVWSVDPTLTAAEVRATLENSAYDLGAVGWDQEFGHGRINALRALETFMVLTLQDANSGLEIEGPIAFLTDDETEQLPMIRQLNISTSYPGTITWTATISPEASWVEITPLTTGQLSAQSVAGITLVSTRPSTYGAYTSSIVVTGTTPLGTLIGPTTNPLILNYVPELYRYRMPLIFKD